MAVIRPIAPMLDQIEHRFEQASQRGVWSMGDFANLKDIEESPSREDV